jgi:leucyl-tRNA synthetase
MVEVKWSFTMDAMHVGHVKTYTGNNELAVFKRLYQFICLNT